MLPRLVRRYVAQSTARTYSSATPAAATSAYPYSSNVVLASSRTEPVTEALRKGKGLMEYLRRTLPTPEKREMIETLFGRRHPKRLLPASVLTVTSTQAPHSFTGILLSIRRRGPDTSFLLRNIVHGTGVELQFFVNSPHLVNIKVEQRAGGQGDKETRRQRRAKVFYLRNAPKKMSGIARRERGAWLEGRNLHYLSRLGGSRQVVWLRCIISKSGEKLQSTYNEIARHVTDVRSSTPTNELDAMQAREFLARVIEAEDELAWISWLAWIS